MQRKTILINTPDHIKERQKQYFKMYYEKNIDKLIQKGMKYNTENRETYRTWQRANYRKKHPNSAQRDVEHVTYIKLDEQSQKEKKRLYQQQYYYEKRNINLKEIVINVKHDYDHKPVDGIINFCD
jgi:hypothetical protein